MRASHGSQAGECRRIPGIVIILELQASKRRLVVAASLQWLEVRGVSCTCRGCVLETVDMKSHPEAAWSMPAFAAQRSTKPCTMEACRALLSGKLVNLALSILGKQACIFNDQVNAMQLAFTLSAVGILIT